MLKHWLILDVASAAIEDAAAYLDPPEDRQAPGNYTKADSIREWQQKDYAADVAKAALDLDLARITGIGSISSYDGEPQTLLIPRTALDERPTLTSLALSLGKTVIITFGGHRFDLPLLMRRAKYLGVPFPRLNIDRYKSQNIDLYEVLTNRGQLSSHSLRWYCRRHQWTDCVKPLSGAEEAHVPQTGRWQELEQSLRADVMATYRLACWLELIEPVSTLPLEPAALR